ncbi:MAG: hypothetical protein GY809_08985, partial [Planctomycetes bacterium]|nr:hypothetical protein [Planctomycetota bacterium]
MIVPMSKVYIVTQTRSQDQLLDAMGDLSVVHVAPVDPSKAVAHEDTLDAMAETDMAIRTLAGISQSGKAPDLSPLDAAREAIAYHKAILDEREQLASLQRQADQLAVWGNVELKSLRALQDAGLDVQFFLVPETDLQDLNAECLEILTQTGTEALIAVVDRTGEFVAPEGARSMPWPAKDLPTVKSDAAMLDASIKENDQSLATLAVLLEDLKHFRQRLDTEASLCIAQRSGLHVSSLFALQGWVPSSKANSLGGELKNLGIQAAVDVIEPEEDEEPPTLIQYPKWAVPIKALFDMLGTLPGYKEMDLSPFFMIGLPLFAAMLIGDAGYGMILAGAGFVFYKKLVKAAGKPAAQLLIIFGLATLTWGVMSGNYFGVTPQSLEEAGFVKSGEIMAQTALLWREDGEAGRVLVMKISLLLGCIHLIIAHLRRVVELWPNVRAFAEVGWIIILTDMMALIWYLMFIGADQVPGIVGMVLLGGLACVTWCSEPHSNPVKRILTGFASSILPLLGTFSDIMSYIRLFAVGLASYYIADAFNGLGAQVAGSATWIAGAPIVIFG